uniref:GPI inositol-deacylase n=1 Tax=Elaeophora elaphi TaxID=1147741 RepID=A0A0R3RRD8_9BILA
MKLHMKNLLFATFIAVTFRLLYMIGNRPWMRINQCEMTYMYRIMNFMRVDIGLTKLKHGQTEDIRYPFSNDFSGYSTILYGEGEYARNYMRTEQVNGLPIIFVPGNAGSSKQVRSLGSILHNKTESRNLPFTFDVFAIDFNEELSGLSAMYLERQIKYLELAVRHIWSMYTPPPHGIIFVGHSMGGIVIRSLLHSANFDPSRIAFIITLGTPHKNAPMVFDWYLKNIYDRMHESWRERQKELANLLVLSVSGGLKDHLVPEHFTLDNGIRHISTTAVDGIELETDHLCIVWCNQLVRYISRLVIEYAYDPSSFHKRADGVVKQLFDADGLLRELTRMRVSTSTEITVRNESIFVRNNDEDLKEFVLSFPKNSWLFIERSIGSSLWTSSGEPIYSLNNLRQTSYTLVHSNVTERISIHLKPEKFFEAVALEEDMAKFDSVVHIGLWSLLKGCFTVLWETDFEGPKAVILLPVHFGTPGVAIVVSLELESCTHTNEWFAKVEFRSQDLRRISSLGGSKELQIVGHLLDRDGTKAEIFFILNRHCRYHARLDISYLDTLIVKLVNLFIRPMKGRHSKRSVESRRSYFNELTLIATTLFINYSYNGFFALVIIVVSSLLQLLKIAIFSKTVSLSSFSEPILLIVLHFYAVLVYVPFGVCSMWNIIRYGLFAVYEDPARIPTYCMIFLKLIQLWTGKIHFFRAHYISVAVLVYTALIQPFTCIAQLGFSFIAIIGLSWFVNPSELKPEKN